MAAASLILTSTSPTLLLFLSIVSAHLGAAFAYYLFPVIGPLGMVSLRLLFSAIIMVCVTRPSLSPLIHSGGWLFVAYSLLMVMMNSCFYLSIERIPLGITITIAFMGPLTLSVLMSRRLLDFIWVALAISGVGVLTPNIGDSLDPAGLALAALDGLCWAGLVIISPRMASITPGNSGLAISMCIASLIMLPIGLSKIDSFISNPIILLYGLGVAFLSTTLTFTFEYEALKRLSVRVYGLIISLEPGFAAVIGAIVLNQRIGLLELIAIACVIIAATGATLTKKSKVARK